MGMEHCNPSQCWTLFTQWHILQHPTRVN